MIVIIVLLVALLVAAAVWIVRLHGERAGVNARLEMTQAELERVRADEERFRSVATDVMARTRGEMRSETSEQMQNLLDPLKQTLSDFQRMVDSKYTQEAVQRQVLREKIDELRLMNDSMATEARRLTDALRGNNKQQGNWGEMVLQSMLENAGLREGEQFVTQQRLEGGKQPDVMVLFPGDGCVVIDSKASLTAYMNYLEAETDEARRVAGKAHVASVRKHIDELHSKNYQDLTGHERRLEFVMMFMPNEGAYMAAMQLEPNLWQEAYDKRVVIISPTHLLSVLKLVEQMWRHDAQTRNAMAIAKEAGDMYDKFVGFVDELQKVETCLARATESIETAKKRLSTGKGNLMTRAERLRELGAKTTKRLPEI